MIGLKSLGLLRTSVSSREGCYLLCLVRLSQMATFVFAWRLPKVIGNSRKTQ